MIQGYSPKTGYQHCLVRMKIWKLCHCKRYYGIWNILCRSLSYTSALLFSWMSHYCAMSVFHFDSALLSEHSNFKSPSFGLHCLVFIYPNWKPWSCAITYLCFEIIGCKYFCLKCMPSGMSFLMQLISKRYLNSMSPICIVLPVGTTAISTTNPEL